MQTMLKPQKWSSSMMREAMELRAFGPMNWENTKVCSIFRGKPCSKEVIDNSRDVFYNKNVIKKIDKRSNIKANIVSQ